MEELVPGIWHWQARHPEWTDADDAAEHGWGPGVSSYAVVDGGRVALIDPVLPTADGPGLQAPTDGRQAVVVLTCPWHARDAGTLGLPVHSPWAPGESGPEPASGFALAAGDPVPAGGIAHPGLEPIDLVLWFAGPRALVLGDTLIDRGGGLELPDDWGPESIPHGPVLAGLRTLLELPLELVLPTHGPPADRRAFEQAVS